MGCSPGAPAQSRSATASYHDVAIQEAHGSALSPWLCTSADKSRTPGLPGWPQTNVLRTRARSAKERRLQACHPRASEHSWLPAHPGSPVWQLWLGHLALEASTHWSAAGHTACLCNSPREADARSSGKALPRKILRRLPCLRGDAGQHCNLVVLEAGPHHQPFDNLNLVLVRQRRPPKHPLASAALLHRHEAC